MSGYRQFNALWVPVKVCSSTAVFLLIYHWQLMTCWIFKVLHLFCKMLWSICFEVQYWSTLSRKIILFEFFSEYFKFDQNCILEKWAKARMSSLICSFLLFTLDGVASFWILDNVVVSSIIPWTSVFGFYWLADSQIQVFIKVRSVIDKLFLKLPLMKN